MIPSGTEAEKHLGPSFASSRLGSPVRMWEVECDKYPVCTVRLREHGWRGRD